MNFSHFCSPGRIFHARTALPGRLVLPLLAWLASSAPAVVSPAGVDSTAVTLATEPTHRYQFETSPDLATWASAGTPITATQTSTAVNLPSAGPRRYWRARLLP